MGPPQTEISLREMLSLAWISTEANSANIGGPKDQSGIIPPRHGGCFRKEV
jgi:hypothetical protein